MSHPIRTQPIKLVLAWGVVLVPLLWGIAMALASAVKLFT